MKYFLDTEFLEGTQTIYQWGLKTDTWLRIAGVGFILLGIYVFLLLDTYSSLWFLVPAIIMFGISFPSTPPTIDLISIGIVSDDNIYKSIEINKDRFGISEQICSIFKNTANKLGYNSIDKSTQNLCIQTGKPCGFPCSDDCPEQ